MKNLKIEHQKNISESIYLKTKKSKQAKNTEIIKKSVNE